MYRELLNLLLRRGYFSHFELRAAILRTIVIMQTFTHLLTLFLIGFLLSSYSSAQAVVDTAGMKQSIEDVLKKQTQEWNAGSIEKYMDGYARSDSVRFASGGNVSYGWENMLARYKKSYPDKATMGELSFSQIVTTIMAPDAALVFGRWELRREKDKPWGYFTLLFRKGGGGWKIVHDHTSSAEK